MQYRKTWCDLVEVESGESDRELDINSINIETTSDYGEQVSPRNTFQYNMRGSTYIECVQETQLNTDNEGF